MLRQTKLCLMLVILTGLLAATTTLAEWQAIDGPPVGFGYDISISLESGTERIYITSWWHDYPYFSTNRGNSWNRLNNDPDADDAYKVAAHPSENMVVYICKTSTHGGGVYKSIDGGYTFSRSGEEQITNDNVITLEIDPSCPDTVWCASEWALDEDALFRTLDGGDNWSVVDPPDPDVKPRTVEVDPISSDTVFLGSARGSYRGVWRSDDFGSTWSHTLEDAYISAIAVSEDYHAWVFAGGKTTNPTKGIIYKSTDNGQTWDDGYEFDRKVMAIALIRQTPTKHT